MMLLCLYSDEQNQHSKTFKSKFAYINQISRPQKTETIRGGLGVCLLDFASKRSMKKLHEVNRHTC